MNTETVGKGPDPSAAIAGGKEPPKFSGFGNTEPPRSALKSALGAYLYGEKSDRDPLLFAGARQLEAHIQGECSGAVAPPSKDKGKPPPKSERQSTRNWSFTVSQDLSRRANASVAGGAATVTLAGATAWTGTPLTGSVLKAEAAVAIARAASAAAEARTLEIVSQANAIEILFALLIGANPSDHASTIELIDIASAVVAAPLYDVKRLLDVKRPSEVVSASDDALRIPVPGHASFPSGHATLSYALATLLSAVTDADTNRNCRLLRAAARLADNRILAGLHTDSDTAAGTALGVSMGAWLASQPLRAASVPWGDLYTAASSEWK